VWVCMCVKCSWATLLYQLEYVRRLVGVLVEVGTGVGVGVGVGATEL